MRMRAILHRLYVSIRLDLLVMALTQHRVMRHRRGPLGAADVLLIDVYIIMEYALHLGDGYVLKLPK